MLEKLGEGKVFIDHGPIQMVITTYLHNKISEEIAMEVGAKVLEEFQQLSPLISNLKQMHYYGKPQENYPAVLNKMIVAVEKSGYKDLNTLGAVAGSFSDIALEKALELGATRVIINNGGDIALRDVQNHPIKVGIPYSRREKKGQLILSLTGNEGIYGICTSGLGGRSFTKGIATAAVALAADAATADACATYIGNMTDVEDENILRCRAEEIDSETDIKGQMVTLKVGALSQKKKYKALMSGLNAAEELYTKGIIKGCIILIEDTIVKYPDDLEVEMKEL